MVNMWRAEWLKTRKRPANLGILLVSLVCAAFMVATYVGLSIYEGPGGGNYIAARMVLPFPNGLTLPVMLLGVLGNMLGIIFVANSVGSEYSRDTWKAILPRRGSRLPFMAIKLLMGFACMVLLVAVTMAVGQLLAWLGLLILGSNLTISTGPSLADQIKGIAFTLMTMSFYGVLTLLATVATRSTIGGIVAGFVSSAVLNLIIEVSKTLGRLLPAVHLDNLQAHWLFNQEAEFKEAAIAEMNQHIGGAISPYVSLAVVLGYMAAFIAIAMWIFKRRDHAGN